MDIQDRASEITFIDLLEFLKEKINRRSYWGKVTIQFREGEPVNIVYLEETRKISPKGKV